MRITGAQAKALVEARLGRPAADRLEASVVLEAYGGISARVALGLAGEVIALTPRRPLAPSTLLEQAPPPAAASPNGLSMILATLAGVALLAPLTSGYGDIPMARAWHAALPLALGLQWVFIRRYLGGLHGLARFRRGAVSAVVLTELAAFAAFLFGGRPAMGLALTWVGALVVGWRGWGLRYALAMGVGEGLIWAGFVPRSVGFAALVLATLAGAAVAAASAEGQPPLPAPWRRAAPSGLIGSGVGLLFVFALPRHLESAGFLLAVVPSMVGGMWGGHYLGRLWNAVPRGLVGTSISAWRPGSSSRRASAIFAGALLRLATGTAGASLLVVLLAPSGYRAPGVLAVLFVSFTAVGTVSLVASVLDTFSRPGWGVAAVAVAVLAGWVAIGHSSATEPSVVPSLLALGTAILAAARPLTLILGQPDRMIATAV